MFSLLKESINDDLQNIVDRELIRSEAVTNSSKLELDTLSDLEECIQHRHSDVIEFIRYGKQIQKGCCLGHSDKGCITFSGIDLTTGQLLCITEWMIKYSQLDAKCAVSCRRENSDMPCVEHGVDAVIANIENQMMILAQLKHKNLVHYECVQCVKQADGILVYVAQDFVLGNTIDNLSHCLGWCDLSVSMVARSIMEALLFLQSKSITHGLLTDSTVYIDNCSTIRVTNFALAPYIQDLIGEPTVMKNDLNALGVLVESLSPTSSTAMRDFIDKCNSQDEDLTIDFLDHPFLQPELWNMEISNDEQEINKIEVVEPTCTLISPTSTSGSRFKSDYTFLEHLGSGAYGVVSKAKNNIDNRIYAIKEIRLEKNRKLNDLTNEVKLISRLNHENIVRYYTSWFETKPLIDDLAKSDHVSDSYSISTSDYFLPVNSSYNYSDEEESDCEDMTLHYLYIQMEYCDNTLRTIIENQLYADINRLWRLFREIVEGLAYIHQHGIAHRDLKPDNIFVQSQDRIKIGDFGLAAICHPTAEFEDSVLDLSIKIRKSGETLDYDFKFDMYSLGLILFDMSSAPFNNQKEQYQGLKKLMTKSDDDTKDQLNVKIIQWLLNHNPNDRPTAEQLLASKLLPISESKTNEINEIICNTIAHRESKEYKNLVAQCLQQESEVISDLTYYDVPSSNTFDYVKSKIVKIFRKHGGIEVTTPLLTQCSKNYVTNQNTVRLMTHSGNNVFLPYDLRLPFARHVAINGINSMRRYSIDRIYREEFNYHPMQLYECAFDIVTPNPGSLLVDAELISIAYEIAIKVLPTLKQKNLSIRINHTSLLRAIFMDFNVPPSKYDDIASNLLLYTEGKIVKSRIKQILNIPNPRNSANLFKVLTTEISLSDSRNAITDLYLKTLIEEPSTAANLARRAIQDIESVVELARGLGVTCEFSFLPGLPVAYERTKCGGIVWQMLAKQKFILQKGRYLLAAGERYDTFLTEFQKAAHNKIISLPKTKICGAGFSFSLENLMYAYATLPMVRIPNLGWAPVQILVCVLSTGPPLNDVIDILNSLWAIGICSGFIEATSSKNARDMARKLGARNLILQSENKGLILRTFVNQNMLQLQDRQITRAALINTIKRMMQPDENNFEFIIDDLKHKMSAQQRERLMKLQNKMKKKRLSGKLSRPKSQ